MVDSPFNKNAKNISFFKEVLIRGTNVQKIYGKFTITRTSIVMQIGASQFRDTVYLFYPRTYRILRFRHLQGGFLAQIQKTRSWLTNGSEIWYQ